MKNELYQQFSPHSELRIVYDRAWDNFQAVWLIKHLGKICAKGRIVLFKMKPDEAYREYEKPVLENLYHWYEAKACLFHAVSTLHIWGPYFYIITIFLLHISIWRLIGLNPSCVRAVAGAWLLLHRAGPSFLPFQQSSCSLKPPASCLGPFWSRLSVLKAAWQLWREVLAELMQREEEPLLPS